MFHEDWYSVRQLDDVSNLLKKVKDIDGKIVEIGCWEGKSTIRLANTCFPEILICNDTWLGNIQESLVTGVEHATEKILKERDVYATFTDNMELHTEGNYRVVKQDCIEWLKTFKEPIKFIHIDASHEYESVFETINLALPNLVKGGVICGDDYLSANINCHDLHGGVERAVKETLPKHSNIGNLWYFINN
jgi:predicted O-methyltransferase YrrM